jgi:DNA-binding NarL/FixJ family response regulator
MNEPRPWRVGLLEDDPTMRRRLTAALEQDPLYALVWSGDAARACCAWLHSVGPASEPPPDVLLVDLGLPDGSGIDVIQTCRRLHPACDVMVVTLFADDASLLQAFAAGAGGYLLKDGSERELARHVRDLRSGGSPMSPIIARRLLQHWQSSEGPANAPQRAAPTPTPTPRERLTVKESAVLGLIARGFTYDEAAQRLGLSSHTVHTHVRNIYGKLDARNKTEALSQARALGWLE